MSGSAWMLIVFVTTISIGVPIPICAGIATAVGLYFLDIPFALLAQTGFQAYEPFPLLTIPLFILSGRLMQSGGMAERLIDVADKMVGSFKGGLGQVTVVGCGFFSALCGSGPATTAAIGTVTIPAMKKENYSNRFAGGVAAAGGALGTMIPPSNMLIMYALVAEESIPRLFLAGVLPGIAITLLLLVIVWVLARFKNFGGHRDKFKLRALLVSTWHGKWAIGAPVLVLGGIYAGFFTPTEAAGMSVFYALFVGLVIHRELNLEKILEALKFTSLFGGLLLILGPTIAFGQLITLYDIPIQVESIITSITTSPFFVLLLIGLFFMIVGMFMDSLAQIVIFTPVLLPVVKNIGIDPIFFGVFVALTCEIGFLTPPVGANLFVSARILDDKLEEMSIGVLPFILAYGIVLIAFCFSQDWVVVLPDFFYGSSN